MRDERRGDALRRERVLPSDTGNQRLQVRVQAGLQRNRNRVHGRVHGLLRQRGSLPEGFAGTTVLQMQRKLHRETMHREVRILLHHGRNSRRRYFNHLRRSSRMDDLCQVSHRNCDDPSSFFFLESRIITRRGDKNLLSFLEII